MKQNTKPFPLRVLLSVTTGRLLTESKGDRDNGIGDIYELLGWMTDDQPFTHQLPRFARECEPYLLKWFPELAPCGVAASLASLDRWLKSDKTSAKDEGVKMWLAELKMMFPALKRVYEVPQIPKESHTPKDAVRELIELRESKENIVIVESP